MSPDAAKIGCDGSDAMIYISNSFCKIKGFEDKHVELIKNLLTYENSEVIYEINQTRILMGMAFRYKNIKRANWLKHKLGELEDARMVCWLRGDTFPTGHLPMILGALDAATVAFHVEDLRVNNAKRVEYTRNPALPPLRYYQQEMLDLGIKENRGVYVSCVGSGKSRLYQELTYALKVPTLIVVPAKDLCVQLYDGFVEFFGEKSVGLLDDAKLAVKPNKPNIRLCTIHTLTALAKRASENMSNHNPLDDFLADVGMLIIEEIHHAGCATYTTLLPKLDHIYYKFGGTGTFLRNDSKTLDMHGVLSDVLYTYTPTQAIREGFLTPLKVVVHQIAGVRGSDYQNEYATNYCKNDELLYTIRDIIREANHDAQILILVGRKEQSGHVITKYLKEIGISNIYVDGDCDRAHTKQAIADFNAKRVHILIGTDGVVGEGIDLYATNELIIAYNTKSEIKLVQSIGRAVRLAKGKTTAIIHDIHWENTKYLEKHLQKRLQLYVTNFAADITTKRGGAV